MIMMASRQALVVLTCLVLQILPQIGLAEVVDRIVAEVNDEIITLSELENMARGVEAQSGTKPTGKESREMQRQMLDALIDRKLAKAEAKRRGITAADKEVDQALERFKQRNNLADDAALNKALSQVGLTLKEMRQQIRDQIIQERLLSTAVGSKVTVSEADVRRLYDERFKEGGAQVHLRTIAVPFPPGATAAQKEEKQQQADTVIKEAKQGRSFPDIARKMSLSDSDLGFVPQNDLDPRLGEFISRLKPGEVAPVQTPEGFQLIQVVGRRTGQARSLEEAAPEIRKFLATQQMEKQFGEWVKTLRDKAHIKVML